MGKILTSPQKTNKYDVLTFKYLSREMMTGDADATVVHKKIKSYGIWLPKIV